jgi:putative proteasome-type protease
MTYCLGILLRAGLVLASDSRSNAGVDQIQRVSKLALFGLPEGRVVAILSAGNLATTQSVVSELEQAAGSGDPHADVTLAGSLYDVAALVGTRLRKVLERDAKFVRPEGDPGASFLVAGQLPGEAPRLFQVYSAGNFIEASERSCFLQIGETKYGKPILDRAPPQSSIDHAAKLALLSFDATIRSNLSVGMPIDLVRYRADSFAADLVTLDEDNGYWRALTEGYSHGLSDLVDRLPSPPPDFTGFAKA